jgi:hypothetical protein
VPFWANVAGGTGAGGLPPIPAREGVVDPHGRNCSASNLDALEDWLAPVIPEWDDQPTTDQAVGAARDGRSPTDAGGLRRAQQHAQAVDLASALFHHRESFRAVAATPNPTGDIADTTRFRDLCGWLLGDADSPEDVLSHMLQLDVVLVAVTGSLAQVEQEVELVQMSCIDRAAITGIQMHHFGAFYRASWRANDWIEGRLDGARHIMRMLLAPEWLRQRGWSSETALSQLHDLAVPADLPEADRNWLATEWTKKRDAYQRELDEALGDTGPNAAGQDTMPVTALDGISEALSLPLQLAILREDLATLADAIRDEQAVGDAMPGSLTWLDAYKTKVAHAQGRRRR